MSGVFISYKHDDESRIVPIVKGLKSENIAVWWDKYLQDGDIFPIVIQEKLDELPHVLVNWSTQASKSRYVIGEALAAFDQGKLLQVVLDDSRLMPPFNTVQATFLTDWSGDPEDARWRKLVARIRGEAVEGLVQDSAQAAQTLSNRQITRTGVSRLQSFALWFMPFLLLFLIVAGLGLAFEDGVLPITPEQKQMLFLGIGGGVITSIGLISVMLTHLLMTSFEPPKHTPGAQHV